MCGSSWDCRLALAILLSLVRLGHRSGCGRRRCIFSAFNRVALPEPDERFREGLGFDGAVGVAGIAGENKLVVIAFGGEDFGHVLIGDDPVMHVVALDVG